MYNTRVSFKDIDALSLSDLRVLKLEILEKIEETYTLYGTGNFDQYYADHRDSLVESMNSILQIIDELISKRLATLFTITMPDGSDALTYRPQKKTEASSNDLSSSK